ncbi:PTS sugar transporter subunit IIA [Vagococcus sp. BWB3-3]|uniref:PTS sugar transporter subunit IIA n=1 Tax=Vagococcus allomyrinae TaxID=2794353 RepID=A0A940PE06_9ENTE|nr:PTS sugar transporter subunit IIA [Vagococcus allomyrinae]MBP1042857.1 PTS sugar transporter subunit IIA [Vagococcus allomyrinae]
MRQPILILTHGGWGEHLLASIKMIVGAVEEVYEVPLAPEDNLNDYIERVDQRIKALTWSDQLLILTDIKGGTTSNVALRLSREYQILAISGLNTALLLEAIMKQTAPFTESTGQELLAASQANNVILEIPKIN